MEYGNPEHRKSKKQLRKKRRQRVYKKGGKYRTTELGDKNS